MDIQLWLTFVGASLLISVAPGAGAITAMSGGMRYGIKKTIPSLCGLQFGYALQILVVGVGLGAILASSVMAFQVIKWLGIGYLVWLGYKKFTEQPEGFDLLQGRSQSMRKHFFAAAFVNIVNPKVTVFLVAFFPQFLDLQAGNIVSQYLILGATVVIVDFFVMLTYACLASRLSKVMRSESSQRLQNRVFGGLYVGVASLMAAS